MHEADGGRVGRAQVGRGWGRQLGLGGKVGGDVELALEEVLHIFDLLQGKGG